MACLGRFMNQSEREYCESRKKAISGLGKNLLVDNPFLFASRFSVNDMLIRVELFKKIRNVSGAIVECGVEQGNHLMLFGHLSSILEPYAINRRILGFDSFAGFRSISDDDPKDISEDDFGNSSPDIIRQSIELYDMNRAVGHMKRVEIVEGDATETIPHYVKQHPELTIALLYLDFDIYKPTVSALTHLLPLVCKGGIVALDEFNYEKFPGETQAVREMLNVQDIELKRFYFAPFLAYFKI